jgi:signal transduction histidine kinase
VTIQADLIDASALPPLAKPAFPATQYHRIAISDTGIGFDEKYLDRIFEVFQRLHGRNQYAGTGIGLAIVQKVVENHGGAINATSQPGQGATFYVFFPV